VDKYKTLPYKQNFQYILLNWQYKAPLGRLEILIILEELKGKSKNKGKGTLDGGWKMFPSE